MKFIVYHVASTLIISRDPYAPTHNSERAAKCARTRYLKAHPEVEAESVAIAEAGEFYESIELMVERTNLISRQTYEEPVNTPIGCSPASETYWSA